MVFVRLQQKWDKFAFKSGEDFSSSFNNTNNFHSFKNESTLKTRF